MAQQNKNKLSVANFNGTRGRLQGRADLTVHFFCTIMWPVLGVHKHYGIPRDPRKSDIHDNRPGYTDSHTRPVVLFYSLSQFEPYYCHFMMLYDSAVFCSEAPWCRQSSLVVVFFILTPVFVSATFSLAPFFIWAVGGIIGYHGYKYRCYVIIINLKFASSKYCLSIWKYPCDVGIIAIIDSVAKNVRHPNWRMLVRIQSMLHMDFSNKCELSG